MSPKQLVLFISGLAVLTPQATAQTANSSPDLLNQVCRARAGGVPLFRGEYTYKLISGNDLKPDEPTSVFEVVVVQGVGVRKAESLRTAAPKSLDSQIGRRIVYCDNGRYGFVLNQTGGAGAVLQTFAADEGGRAEIDESLANAYAIHEAISGSLLFAPYSNAITNPLTRLTGVNDAGSAGSRTLEIAFKWSPTTEERQGVSLGRKWREAEISDTARLSEADGWNVVHSILTTRQKSSRGDLVTLRTETTIRYESPTADGIHPVGEAVTRTYRGDNYAFTVTHTGFKYTPRAVVHEEFTLSHYGLPEPEGVPPPKQTVPWHVWLLTGAVVLGGLAVLFGWWRRRVQPRARPATH